jgi:hypothetical protein
MTAELPDAVLCVQAHRREPEPQDARGIGPGHSEGTGEMEKDT